MVIPKIWLVEISSPILTFSERYFLIPNMSLYQYRHVLYHQWPHIRSHARDNQTWSLRSVTIILIFAGKNENLALKFRSSELEHLGTERQQTVSMSAWPEPHLIQAAVSTADPLYISVRTVETRVVSSY
jgi:hypothetical protein